MAAGLFRQSSRAYKSLFTGLSPVSMLASASRPTVSSLFRPMSPAVLAPSRGFGLQRVVGPESLKSAPPLPPASSASRSRSSSSSAPAARRFWQLLGSGVMFGTGIFWLLNSLESEMMFFMTPTDLVHGDEPISLDRKFRLGGLVVEGSVDKRANGQILFTLTDLSTEVVVQYRGMLPDLFKEGSSIVCEGKLNQDGFFQAYEVLAKHDESYMPAAVREAVAEREKEEVLAAA